MLSLFKRDRHPDVYQTTDEIIESRGFICDNHEVETKDGYLLTIHRIVIPKVDYSEKSLEPILLQHGFSGCSAHWLVCSRDGHFEPHFDNNNVGESNDKQVSNNLGFALSNKGYDVWLGNFRGNRYSQKHKSLSAKDKQFWDFSCDEMIEHDLPSMIDYILKVTQKSKLGFVGFSLGTTTMFGLLASKPEYNEKVRPFIALAPVATGIKPTRGLYRHMQNIVPYFPSIANWYETGLINSIFTGHIFAYYLQRLILLILSTSYGIDWKTVDDHALGTFLSHSGGISGRCFLHFFQWKDKTAKYDFRETENRRVYGQENPPEYEVDKITNRSICLLYAKRDRVSGVEQINEITSAIKVPVYQTYEIPNRAWGHLNFNLSKDLGPFLNRKIISLLDDFNAKQ